VDNFSQKKDVESKNWSKFGCGEKNEKAKILSNDFKISTSLFLYKRFRVIGSPHPNLSPKGCGREKVVKKLSKFGTFVHFKNLNMDRQFKELEW
jgi:hypothetical protein